MPFGLQNGKNDGFTKRSVESWKSYMVIRIRFINRKSELRISFLGFVFFSVSEQLGLKKPTKSSLYSWSPRILSTLLRWNLVMDSINWKSGFRFLLFRFQEVPYSWLSSDGNLTWKSWFWAFWNYAPFYFFSKKNNCQELFHRLPKFQVFLCSIELLLIEFVMHSNLENVLIEKKSPKETDNKFIEYSHQTTIFHFKST